jgi:hypothetical protein
VTTLAVEGRQVEYQPRSCLSWLRIAEPPLPLSEAELGLIWAGQRFPAAALATVDGRPVRVVHPGRGNGGPGPDFRDAVVFIDGEERRGDVELHLQASSFQAHGHHLDPAYDGVILHVVYLPDDGLVTGLNNGNLVPVAAFGPWLDNRAGELEKLLAAPGLWREPCQDAGARLGDEAIAAALVAAGAERFATKVAQMTAAIQRNGESRAVWSALLEALGTGGDLSFPKLTRLVIGEGTFDALVGGCVEDNRFLKEALLYLAGLGAAPLTGASLPPPIKPALARVGRPANWPERRLAAFARLYERADGDLVAYAVESVGAANAGQLVIGWQVADRGGTPALLGQEKARELVVNAVLPFAAAARPALAPKTLALLRELKPGPAYGKTAFLERNLVRSDGRRRVRNALEQQGLLAFRAQWCSQGGCGKCPLSPPGPAPGAGTLPRDQTPDVLSRWRCASLWSAPLCKERQRFLRGHPSDSPRMGCAPATPACPGRQSLQA